MRSALLTLLLAAIAAPAPAQPAAGTTTPHPGMTRVSASTPDELAAWARRIERLVAAGALVVGERHRGPDERLDEWFTQQHRGVPVAGGEVRRRTERGEVVAVEGTLYEDIAIGVEPRLSAEEAREAFTRRAGGGLGPSLAPALVVLPVPDGSYLLTWAARLFAGDTLSLVYLDAATGAIVLRAADPGPPPASGGMRAVPRRATRDDPALAR